MSDKANIEKIIPECGLESAASDIMTYLVVSLIREKLKVGVKDVSATNSVLMWVSHLHGLVNNLKV